MKSKTIKLFNDIIEKEGAFIPEGMTNPIKINGDEMIMYCLYKNKVYECLLDLSTLEIIKNKGTWIAHGRKDRDEIYILSAKHSMLHRCLKECPKGMVVDHENGNSLDNRLSNLRVVTQGTNMLNKSVYKNNTHGISNLSKRGSYTVFHADRIFKSKKIALEVAEKVNEILNHYSKLDALNRTSKIKKNYKKYL